MTEDKINCEILKEYLDMASEMGVPYEDANPKQLDQQIPSLHQSRIMGCGVKNARTCQRIECPSNVGRNANA